MKKYLFLTIALLTTNSATALQYHCKVWCSGYYYKTIGGKAAPLTDKFESECRNKVGFAHPGEYLGCPEKDSKQNDIWYCAKIENRTALGTAVRDGDYAQEEARDNCKHQLTTPSNCYGMATPLQFFAIDRTECELK